jgi:hypothetical protein
VKIVRFLVPLALLALLLSLGRSADPVPETLPYETHVYGRVHDPLRTFRRIMGSPVVRAALEAELPEVARSRIGALTHPDFKTALVLAGVRMVHVAQGAVTVDGAFTPFRLVGVDMAFLPLLSRIVGRLPGVTRDGEAYVAGDARFVFRGDVAWIGDARSIGFLDDVRTGRRDSLAEKNPFAAFLMKSLDHGADASAAVFSHHVLLDRFPDPSVRLDVSALVDKDAFGGAGFDGYLADDGLTLSGVVVATPGGRILPACSARDGRLALPALFARPPARYVGLRAGRPEDLADVMIAALPAGSGDSSIRDIFLRGFARNLGGEAALVVADRPGSAPLAVFDVGNRAELDRYLRTLEQMVRRTAPGRYEPGTIAIGPIRVSYRLTERHFLFGLNRDDVDAAAAVDAQALPASDAWSSGLSERDLSGCVLAAARLGAFPKLVDALGPAGDADADAVLSVREEKGQTRLDVRVPFENPITPLASANLAVARAIYMGIATLYLAVLALLLIWTVRGGLRLARSLRAPAPKVEQ